MEQKEVLVIGGFHHNTLGVVRALGEKGIPKDKLRIFMVGKNPKKPNIISSSKYVSSHLIDYIEDAHDIADRMMRLAEDGKRRCVICCSDLVATEVINNKRNLHVFFDQPDSEIDINLLMSKEYQQKVAEDCGLNIPQSAVIQVISGGGYWSTFPAIIKPLRSAVGGGKQDIKIVNNEAELNRELKETVSEEVQIQEYLDKEIEFQLIGCSLNEGEKIIIPGYTDIIRQSKKSNTGYLKYSPITGFNYDKDAVEKFIRKIGYSGLFSVEFLRGKDGRDYFLEINMRNDGNAYCVTCAGVNLPYIWVYYNMYGKLPECEPLIAPRSVMMIPDFSDLALGVKTVGFIKWLKQFFSAECHTLYSLRDPLPFWTRLMNYLLRR